MPSLDDIVVRVRADLSDFKKGMSEGEKSLDAFGNKSKQVGDSGGAIGKSLGDASGAIAKFSSEIQKTSGATDEFTKRQASVINSLGDAIMKTRLSGQELATYTALRKAGTTAETDAGRVIASLATQHFNLTNAQREGVAVATSWGNIWKSAPGSLAAAGTAINTLGRDMRVTQTVSSAFVDGFKQLTPTVLAAGSGLAVLSSHNDRLGVSLRATQGITTVFGNELRTLDPALAALNARQVASAATMSSWRNLWGLLGPSVAGATGALAAHGAVVGRVAAEHESAGAATRGFREGIHILNPVLAAAGMNIEGLGRFTGAARAGVIGLATAITGSLIFALAKAGDEAIIATKRLGDLTGSKEAGKNIFGALEESAKHLGVSVGTLTGPMEAVLRLMQDQNRIAGVVYAPGANSAAAFSGNVKTLGTGLENLGKFLRSDIKDGTEFGAVLSGVFQSLGDKGQFTAKGFDLIDSKSRATAIEIAKAFGGKDVATFRSQVDGMQISFIRVLEVLARLGPQAKAALDQSRLAGTVGQAFDELARSAENLWKKMTVDPGVKTSIAKATEAIGYLTEHTDIAKGSVVLLGGALGFAFGGPIGALIAGVIGAVVLFIKEIMEAIGWVEQLILKTGMVKSPQAAQAAVSAASTGALGGAVSGAIVGGIAGGPFGAIGGGIAGAVLGGVIGGGTNIAGNNLSGPFAPPSEMSNYLGNLPAGQIPAYGGFSASDENPSYFATGVDRIIPSGYPGDSFDMRMKLSSGERLIVVPAGQTLGEFLGGNNPIDLGKFAIGTDLSVGSGGTTIANPPMTPLTGIGPSSVDAMATPQGNRVLDLVISNQDIFKKLGVTIEGAQKAITGAGHEKVTDVFRVENIKLISAIHMEGTSIVKRLTGMEGILVGAINAGAASIGGAVSSAVAAAAAASAASSTGIPSPGAAVGGDAGGAVNAAIPRGGAVGGAVKSETPNEGMSDFDLRTIANFGSGAAAQQARDILARRNPYIPMPQQAPHSPMFKPIETPKKYDATSQASFADAPAGVLPGIGTGSSTAIGKYDNPTTGPYTGVGGDYYATGQPVDWRSLGGADFSGAFARPGEFDVPSGFANDSFRAKLNLSSGENVSVKRYSDSDQGGHGSSGGGGRTINISRVEVTVIADKPAEYVATEDQIAKATRSALNKMSTYA